MYAVMIGDIIVEEAIVQAMDIVLAVVAMIGEATTVEAHLMEEGTYYLSTLFFHLTYHFIQNRKFFCILACACYLWSPVQSSTLECPSIKSFRLAL